MLDAVFSTDREALLAAVPLISALLLGFFRLDSLLAAPRTRTRRSVSGRPASGIDQNGEPIFCDPDGRRQPPR